MKERTFIVLGALAAGWGPLIVGGLYEIVRSGPTNTDYFLFFGLGLVVYVCTVQFVCLFGLPVFLLLRHYRLARWWSAILYGSLAGCAFAVIAALPNRAHLEKAVLMASGGALSALLFFAVWKRGAQAT